MSKQKDTAGAIVACKMDKALFLYGYQLFSGE